MVALAATRVDLTAAMAAELRRPRAMRGSTGRGHGLAALTLAAFAASVALRLAAFPGAFVGSTALQLAKAAPRPCETVAYGHAKKYRTAMKDLIKDIKNPKKPKAKPEEVWPIEAPDDVLVLHVEYSPGNAMMRSNKWKGLNRFNDECTKDDSLRFKCKNKFGFKSPDWLLQAEHDKDIFPQPGNAEVIKLYQVMNQRFGHKVRIVHNYKKVLE